MEPQSSSSDVDSELTAAITFLSELEVETRNMTRLQIMAMYRDLSCSDIIDEMGEEGAGEDFHEHYVYEAVKNAFADIDINSPTAPERTVREPLISPPPHQPSGNHSDRPHHAVTPSASEDDEYDALERSSKDKIQAVCDVLCCTHQEALFFLKRNNWVEVQAITAFIDQEGVMSEDTRSSSHTQAGSSRRVAHDDVDFVRAPDEMFKTSLLPERRIFSTVLIRQAALIHNEMEEPGVEWMFQLPSDYPNSKESLKRARVQATAEMKYLLVNIQSDKEFACHSMNRDSWPDTTVKTIIQSSYVFWQRGVTSIAGQSFLNLYSTSIYGKYGLNPADTSIFPGLYFIDPRTGQLVKLIQGKGFLNKDDLASILLEFTSSHPTESWRDVLPPPPHTTKIEHRTTAPALIDYGDVPVEPDANDTNVCKIALKLRNSSSVVRRFRTSDPVCALFAFAKSIEVATAFDLREKAPPYRYLSHVDCFESTIGEVGLGGSKIEVCDPKE